MRRKFLVCSLLLAPYSFAGDCEKHEALIASCHLSWKIERVASFCANEEDGTAKYKFLRNGSLELNVDFTAQKKLKRWLDIGTYSTYLGFNRDAY